MMIYFLKILLAGGILFVLFYFYVRYLEQRTTYLPSRSIESNPGEIGLAHEDIFFNTSDDIRLHGWWIPAENAKITLIFCHGNGGNISHRLEKISFLNKLGLNLFIFDYRGYGQSNGSPSEEGLYRDIEAAYEFIRSRGSSNEASQKIVVYGASLGGAIAVDLAGKHTIDGLILEGTFSSAVEIAKVFYPFIPSFFVNSKFDSYSKISKINIPKLIMHSEADDIIPFSQGEKLFEAAHEPKRFLKLRGGHNDAFFVSEAEIEIALKAFFDSADL